MNNTPLYVNSTHFVCLQLDGHLGCFHLLCMNVLLCETCVCKYLFRVCFQFFWINTQKWNWWIIWWFSNRTNLTPCWICCFSSNPCALLLCLVMLALHLVKECTYSAEIYRAAYSQALTLERYNPFSFMQRQKVAEERITFVWLWGALWPDRHG